MSDSIPNPHADEIFRPYRAPELDDELVFDQAAELDNPLSPCLVAALRKVRVQHDQIEWSAHVVKASVELIRELQIENTALKGRILALIDENRALHRQQSSASVSS